MEDRNINKHLRTKVRDSSNRRMWISTMVPCPAESYVNFMKDELPALERKILLHHQEERENSGNDKKTKNNNNTINNKNDNVENKNSLSLTLHEWDAKKKQQKKNGLESSPPQEQATGTEPLHVLVEASLPELLFQSEIMVEELFQLADLMFRGAKDGGTTTMNLQSSPDQIQNMDGDDCNNNSNNNTAATPTTTTKTTTTTTTDAAAAASQEEVMATVLIPHSDASLLTGQQGAVVLRYLQESTQTNIQIGGPPSPSSSSPPVLLLPNKKMTTHPNNPPDPPGEQCATIAGTLQACRQAQSLLHQIIADHSTAGVLPPPLQLQLHPNKEGGDDDQVYPNRNISHRGSRVTAQEVGRIGGAKDGAIPVSGPMTGTVAATSQSLKHQTASGQITTLRCGTDTGGTTPPDESSSSPLNEVTTIKLWIPAESNGGLMSTTDRQETMIRFQQYIEESTQTKIQIPATVAAPEQHVLAPLPLPTPSSPNKKPLTTAVAQGTASSTLAVAAATGRWITITGTASACIKARHRIEQILLGNPATEEVVQPTHSTSSCWQDGGGGERKGVDDDVVDRSSCHSPRRQSPPPRQPAAPRSGHCKDNKPKSPPRTHQTTRSSKTTPPKKAKTEGYSAEWGAYYHSPPAEQANATAYNYPYYSAGHGAASYPYPYYYYHHQYPYQQHHQQPWGTTATVATSTSGSPSTVATASITPAAISTTATSTAGTPSAATAATTISTPVSATSAANSITSALSEAPAAITTVNRTPSTAASTSVTSTTGPPPATPAAIAAATIRSAPAAAPSAATSTAGTPSVIRTDDSNNKKNSASNKVRPPRPPVLAPVPAPNTYYVQFFWYAHYYGDAAARQYYGPYWSPPVGTWNPYGVNPRDIGVQPATSPATAAATATITTSTTAAKVAAETTTTTLPAGTATVATGEKQPQPSQLSESTPVSGPAEGATDAATTETTRKTYSSYGAITNQNTSSRVTATEH